MCCHLKWNETKGVACLHAAHRSSEKLLRLHVWCTLLSRHHRVWFLVGKPSNTFFGMLLCYLPGFRHYTYLHFACPGKVMCVASWLSTPKIGAWELAQRAPAMIRYTAEQQSCPAGHGELLMFVPAIWLSTAMLLNKWHEYFPLFSDHSDSGCWDFLQLNIYYTLFHFTVIIF